LLTKLAWSQKTPQHTMLQIDSCSPTEQEGSEIDRTRVLNYITGALILLLSNTISWLPLYILCVCMPTLTLSLQSHL